MLLGASYHAVLGELGARLARFVMAVADERRVEGRLGFHDLLVHARTLLRHDRAATDALRRRYRRLLVDEFQDTDPIQVELAARIAAAVDGSADLRPRREGRALRGGRPQAVDLPVPRADIELFSRVGRRDRGGDRAGHQLPFGPRHPPIRQRRLRRTLRHRARSRSGRTPRADRRVATPCRCATGARLQDGALVPLPRPGTLRCSCPSTGSRRLRKSAKTAEAPRRPAAGMPPVVLLGGPMKASMAEVRRAAARDVAVCVDDILDTRWAVVDEERRRAPGGALA